MIQVTVLFFGGLKEALACSQDEICVDSATPLTLTYVYQELSRRHPRLPTLLASVRLAINEEFLPNTGSGVFASDTVVADGDVIAFIPPVTGG